MPPNKFQTLPVDGSASQVVVCPYPFCLIPGGTALPGLGYLVQNLKVLIDVRKDKIRNKYICTFDSTTGR